MLSYVAAVNAACLMARVELLTLMSSTLQTDGLEATQALKNRTEFHGVENLSTV